MTQPESTSPGTVANQEFINSLRDLHPELEEHVPDNCKDCSTAWLFALRGRDEERVFACPGHGVKEIGSLAVVTCRLP